MKPGPGKEVMRLVRCIAGWRGFRAGLLLSGLMVCCAPAAGPQRVLLVQSYGISVTPFRIGATAFESTLTEAMGKKVDIDDVSLEMARYQQPDLHEVFLEDAFVAFLNERDANWKPDLVVTIGSPAGRFVAKYRNRLFPQTPVLYSSMDWQILVTLDALKTNATYVGTKLDIAGFEQDILQLAPDTTNLVVVIGASPLEQLWANRFRNELASGTNRLHLTFLNKLPFEEMQKRVTSLPAHSFIFLVLMIWDAEGATLTEGEALQRLHAVANAPINSIWRDQLGAGIVGGRLYDAEAIGVQSARVAERILNGEPASAIPPSIQSAGPPQYDWRELKHWGIPEANLPAGSTIRFRPPGFWGLYRWWITGTAVFCVLQTALIVALLVNRAQRRQGQAVATLTADISSKFVNLPAGEVDREIVDSQRRIFEVLGLDVSGFWQWSAEASGFFRITHFSRAGDDPQLPEQMNSQEYLPWFQEQVLAGRTVAISSVEELPPEAGRDRETFRRFGFQSNLTIPLSVGGGVPIGALGFTARAEREWPAMLVKRLQVLAQIFASALARKHADQSLRESEERMTLAAKATGVGVWVWDIPSNKVWGSERWLVLYGFAPDTTVTFEQVIQRIHPDDRRMVEDEVRRARADRADYMGDFRVVLPDGTERWIVARGRMYQDSHGKPARMLGTAIDITYRKQTELELAESELRYRTLFETAPEGIVLIGVDGRVSAANPAQARLYGYESPQQLEGLYAPLCVAEKDRGRATRIMKDLLNGEERSVRYYTAVRRDGSEFIVEVTSSVLRGLGREVQGYLCVTRDITERQQTEQELQRHRMELAHVSRVSTMGALTASLAHELNQPLSAILNNAQAGLRFLTAPHPEIPEVHDALKDIAQDTRRAGEVIRQMRALVRKDEPKLQPLDLNQLIQDVVRLLHSDIVIRRTRIALELQTGMPPIRGDNVQLQQVMLNLLLNAFEAMREVPERNRLVTVRSRLLDLSFGQVEVSDAGTGFSPEGLLKLFEPFRSSKKDGLGLGLSISHSIIEAHRGRLWAENSPAGGATLYFTLPLHDRELDLAFRGEN